MVPGIVAGEAAGALEGLSNVKPPCSYQNSELFRGRLNGQLGI